MKSAPGSSGTAAAGRRPHIGERDIHGRVIAAVVQGYPTHLNAVGLGEEGQVSLTGAGERRAILVVQAFGQIVAIDRPRNEMRGQWRALIVK
jgi:hypothetical protein